MSRTPTLEHTPAPVDSQIPHSSEVRESSFRPDIEGLRAVAILLVVGFHGGIGWLRGGFIGVDIFFVLSGYLITALLFKEVERTGSLNFVRFYTRRIRRLLPASLLMVVVTLLAGFILLSPIEVMRISQSAIATATYASNWWFLLHSTDYFSANVETNPLLHTWSLAVEEQFYLLWPLLVFLCLKQNRPRKTIVATFAAVTIVSFMASVWLTRTLQPLAFFSTPTRAWEFAVGGLATLLQGSQSLRAFRYGGAAWLGTVLILAAGIWMKPTNGFPGAIVLIPVVGTVLVLIAWKPATNQTGVFKLLGSRLFQTLGGLSYSWYLWHWPFLVFGRILLPNRQGPLISILLLLGSLGIAWVTHSLIENPIRFNGKLVANPKYSLVFGLTMTVGGLLLGLLFFSIGHRTAASPNEHLYLDAAAYNVREHDCLTGFRKDTLTTCSFGPSDADTLILFGDSHAEQWLPALRQIADNGRWHVITLLKASCPTAMVPVYNPRLEREEYECSTWRSKALSYIGTIRPSIVLVSNSSGYVKMSSFQDGYAQLSIQQWQAGTYSTLQSLNATAAETVLLRDTPRPDFDVPICLARTSRHPILFPARTCDMPEQQALASPIWEAEVAEAKRFNHVSTLDMTDSFCRADQCFPVLNGMVVFRDSNHMTSTFARSMAPALANELNFIRTVHFANAQTAVATIDPYIW